jgi:hypothetical protein
MAIGARCDEPPTPQDATVVGSYGSFRLAHAGGGEGHEPRDDPITHPEPMESRMDRFRIVSPAPTLTLWTLAACAALLLASAAVASVYARGGTPTTPDRPSPSS